MLLAYLFGSLAARNQCMERPPGDVDLAVLTREGLTLGLYEALTDALGTERLDVVDLKSASPVLRFEILREGRPIYVSDQDIKERYEMETIHLYRVTAPMKKAADGILEEEDGRTVPKIEIVRLLLRDLDITLLELEKYRDISDEMLSGNLSQRWIIERGLEAGAELIFDIGDHILAGQFGYYAETYEDTLKGLRNRDVISEELYLQMKGLGGLRNVLVHRYLQINPDLLLQSFQKALKVFPLFAREILAFLDQA